MCILFSLDGSIVALAAKRLVNILLTKDYQLVAGRKSVGMICRTAAFDADCMNFLYILSDSHEGRHRTEWLTHEISVQAGNDHSHSPVCQSLYNLNYRIVKKLGLVDAYDFNIT